MFRTVCLTAGILSVSASVLAAEQDGLSTPAPQRSQPVERGLPEADACYGASNEKEEDLKTGNEELVHRLLQQMLSPGS